MSEDKRNHVKHSNKGGAHIAKAGSKVSMTAEKSEKASKKGKKMRPPAPFHETKTNPPVEKVNEALPQKKTDRSPLEETRVLPVIPKSSNAVNAPASSEPKAVNNTTPKPPESPDTVQKRNRYADKMNKKKSAGRKRLGLAIGLLIVALMVAGGVFMVVKSRRESNEPEPGSTAVAERGMLETYIEGSGTTAANKREELGKELKGTVSEVLVKVGDEVKKDDVLITVDPTETRQELKAAEQELASAQRDVASAQANVKTAQEEVETARKNLNKLDVTAPFTGKIIPVEDGDGVSKSYRIGQQVSSGETIGYMVDDSQMKLSLYYNAAYAGDIYAGQTATVSIPSTMDSITGTVSSVDATQRVSTEGAKLIKVTVDMYNPGTLTKGMSATATVTAGENGEVYPTDSGVLEYNREEAVSTRNSGEITSLNGIDYDSYTSGATIMTIESDTLQDSLKSAQNALSTQQSAVATAQRQVQSIQTKINQLKKAITESTVKATMDGVVVNVSVEEGGEAGGSTLVTIADLNDIIVNADIAASDVTNVEPGQTAMMTSYQGDGSELILTGTVKSVALEPDQESQNSGNLMFPAVIEIDPVEGQSIPIGQSIEYKITTASSFDSLIVPSAAIVNTETGTAVFAKPLEGETFEETLPIPEGTEGIPSDFVLVPVETGLSDSTNTEILWGIDEGTTVYLVVQDIFTSMEGVG